MKKLNSAIMLAFAVYILQGCTNANKGTDQSADSLHQIANSAPQAPGTGKKQPAPAKPLVMKVDNADATFAVDAARGSLVEIALSVDASRITKDEKIKTFAGTLITGQGKITDEVVAIARTKNVAVPMFISPDAEKNREALEKKSGEDFDKAYISAMIGDYRKALKLYKNAAKNCADTDLKAFAAKTATTIQLYLDAVNKINAGMK
jgi:putative membrane protein